MRCLFRPPSSSSPLPALIQALPRKIKLGVCWRKIFLKQENSKDVNRAGFLGFLFLFKNVIHINNLIQSFRISVYLIHIMT